MEVERARINGNLSAVLSKVFQDRLIASGINADLVTLVFIAKEKDGEKQKAIPILLAHESDSERQNNVLHVESANPEYIKKLEKIMLG